MSRSASRKTAYAREAETTAQDQRAIQKRIDKIDAKALKALIRAAVALNSSKRPKNA